MYMNLKINLDKLRDVDPSYGVWVCMCIVPECAV